MLSLPRVPVLPREVDARALKMGAASLDHVSRIVDSPALIVQGDEPLIAYMPLDPEESAPLLSAVRNLRFGTSSRTAGMTTTSRIFGCRPRLTLRADFCSTCALATEQPAENATLLRWGALLSAQYERVNPVRFARQAQLLEAVRPEWRIPGSVFTQGIVNRNNVLRYHHDRGNFDSVWSVMAVFPQSLTGGELVVPELDMAFAFTRPALLMFDGQRLLHGVAPVQLTSASGFRFSVVYYALKAMTHCLSPQEELVRIRAKKTEREVRRSRRPQ